MKSTGIIAAASALVAMPLQAQEVGVRPLHLPSPPVPPIMHSR
jgi:hypothetical protein